MRRGLLSVEGSSKGNMNSKHSKLKERKKERGSQRRQKKESEVEGRTGQGSRGQ